MKLACTLLLFIPLLAFAQLPSRPGTILWKITSPGGKVSYMMGTNHSYGGTFIDTLLRVKALLHGAECVVLEDFSERDMTVKPDFNGKIPYSKLFSAADYKMMDSVLESYGMNSLRELDSVHYPPHLLAMHFTGQFMSEKDGRMKEEDEAMDNQISRLAKKWNIPRASLDSGFTVREGILQFGLTEQQWADGITKLFRAKASGETVMSDVDGSYGNMQIDYAFAKPQPFEKGSDAHHLLADRNEHWMKVLPQMLKQKKCFVAVGISHLSYKNGLLMELKKLGFKIEPVNVLPTTKLSFRSSQTE